MAKSMIAVFVLLVLFCAAIVYRGIVTQPVDAVDPGQARSDQASSPQVSPLGPNQDGTVPMVMASGSSAAPAPVSHASAFAADRGAANTVPAVTTYVGPDGNNHEIPPAEAELLAMGDENLRAAVMDEIRADPQAFAQAMRVEVEDVERVAKGETELPAEWIVQ